MKRNNKYLLGFAVVVVVPTVLIWMVAWPILRPWHLPDVASGTLVQGEKQRPLSEDELAGVNQWLHHNPSGWGIAGEVPPKPSEAPPEAVYRMAGAKGEPLILSAWHFRHGDDVVGIQTEPAGPYRMRSFGRGTLHLPGLP